MERVALGATEPFAFVYPCEPHRRRHGPVYKTYESYRLWLYDEFWFRCVYCLKRIVWDPTGVWTIDHLVSQDEDPSLACEYDNLVVACGYCNRMKSNTMRVPDPCRVAYGQCLRVGLDGVVAGLDKVGNRLIRELRLNHPTYAQWRQMRMNELGLMSLHNPAEFERLMGFPKELPDLASMKPLTNRRPEGKHDSWFERRKRGELPRTF